MRMVSRIVPFLSVVLLLVAGSALSALNPSEEKSAQKNEHRIRNIVLVHGAWADGSGWKGVYDILVKDGFNVSMVQEPETSFKEDVAATKRVLALHDGPCILVAHSYGGGVITEAGNDSSVVGLVYIAAHMPDAGENEADGGKNSRATAASLARSRRHRTDSPTWTLPGFTNCSQPTFPKNRPPSWRAHRYSISPTILEPDQHGGVANEAKLDAGGRRGPYDQSGP